MIDLLLVVNQDRHIKILITLTFVWYHTGDTAALTDEFYLYELKNAYAFLMLRRKADTSSIDETDARELAAEIIDSLPQLTELEGESYYECEDALTELLNEYKNN